MKRRLIGLNLALVLLLSLLPCMAVPAMAATSDSDFGYAIFYRNDGSDISVPDTQDTFLASNSNLMLYKAMPTFTSKTAVVTSYNTKADGSGTEFPLTSILRQSYSTNADSPAKLYAQWEEAPENHTLYISSNGYLSSDGKDYVLDSNQKELITLRGSDTFLGGSNTWKLVGWDESSPYTTNPDYIVGDVATRPNLTLYSVWGTNAIKFHYSTYSEKYNFYYDTTLISRYTSKSQRIYSKSPTPEAQNSVFVGWNSKADGSGEWWAAYDYAINAPNELYAIFEEVSGYTCLISAYPNALPNNGPMQDLVPLSASIDQITLPGDASDVWATGSPSTAMGFVHEQSDIYTGGMTLDVSNGDIIRPLSAVANLQVSFIENYEGLDDVVTYYDMGRPSYLSFPSVEAYFNELPKNAAFTGWNTKADGTGVQYAVGGFVTVGNLKLYAQWEKTTPITPKAPSITVTTSATSGKPVISWTAVDHATGYEVWRCGTKNGSYTKLTTTDATKLSVTHTGAEVGEDYYYKVRAINEDLTSEFSTAKGVWCDLKRPTVTLSNRASDGKPVIKWTAVEGATGYEVLFCGSKSGTYKHLYTAPADDFDVVHTGAAVGNDYFYKVRAIYDDNTKCNSASSAIKGVWCDLKRPAITVTNNTTTGKPVISWNKVDYAVGYKVYCATGSSTGTYKLIYNGSTNPDKLSVTHVGAEAGEAYYYKVVAVHKNSKCTSAMSTAKGVYCDLARPTLTVTINDNGKPYLSWTESEGADSYKVYRSTDNSTWNLLYTAKSDDFDVIHTGAKAGTSYYYKVRAICETNYKANSAYSAVRSINVP